MYIYNLLLVLMAFFGFYPTKEIFYIPLLIFKMALTASGMGMWITALSIQYRDIKHAITFLTQLLMYSAPVVWPVSILVEKYGENIYFIYGMYPMVGVIEGFRASLLGTSPMPISLIGIGFASSVIIFFTGLLFFNRKENSFADVA